MPPARRIRHAVSSDRQALTNFTCTWPETAIYNHGLRRKTHPCEWELDTQSHFRNFKPPAHWPHRLYVMEDDTGIVALSHVIVTPDPAVLIAATAVSKRAQGTGAGRELMAHVLAEIARDYPDLPVFTNIDRRNERSRRMARQGGFAYLQPFNPEDPADPLDVWSMPDSGPEDPSKRESSDPGPTPPSPR